jgi:hypothetical protein
MCTLTIDRILDAIDRVGVSFRSDTPYDLNLFGIRSNNVESNTFDDLLGCIYRDEQLAFQLEVWPATTDPGLYWLQNPSRVEGTAILVPGQYRGVYRIDMHGGAYPALCQRNGPVKVWRDNNKDGTLDWGGPEYSGYYGINIHHASYSGTSQQVNKWSAGCQVISNISNFNRMMELARLQIQFHPTWESFTYTLLTEDEIK